MNSSQETQWMGEYRELVESIIRLCNAYLCNAYTYANENSLPPASDCDTVRISPTQMQTIEYILESADEHMSEIAKRLGVTRGTFSNNIKRLEGLGLVSKQHRDENKKNIFLVVTPKGIELYRAYAIRIYDSWFKQMFQLADEIPKEHIRQFEKIMNGFADVFYNRKPSRTTKKRALEKSLEVHVR